MDSWRFLKPLSTKRAVFMDRCLWNGVTARNKAIFLAVNIKMMSLASQRNDISSLGPQKAQGKFAGL